MLKHVPADAGQQHIVHIRQPIVDPLIALVRVRE
jgi:hypothetical protein